MLPTQTFSFCPAFHGYVPALRAYTCEIGFEWADCLSLTIIGPVLTFVFLALPSPTVYCCRNARKTLP
ncbi:hypothetical protein BDW72DRAFT_173075 [Aspergillus terricola var. indicus]